MTPARRLALALAFTAAAAGCSRSSPFSTDNAIQHVRVLATNIGTRPAGTAANQRARDYIIDQLRQAGFTVRVQEADGVRPAHGATAHVRNIIATRSGRRPHAIALTTHYDSVPDGPGAADDALGVAVCLEAGRVLAARTQPNYALALVFTDGEELGLMGASALLRDPIVGWMRAVLNFESVGSAGPALLFQATDGSGSLVKAWQQTARRPHGASFMREIYRRLPADTDMTMFARGTIAGIDFAPAADSYPYHTPQDSAQRLDPRTVRQMGENAVRIVSALDETDLSQRIENPSTYFDVARLFAIEYGRWTSAALFALSLLLALFGFVQTLFVARVRVGWKGLLLTAAGALIAVACAFGAMLGAAWLLRTAHRWYHPWYAHPGRFIACELLAAAVAVLLVLRLGRRLPDGARGSTDPSAIWTLVLACWIVLVIAIQLWVPSAAYLGAIPLMVAGLSLAIFSTDSVARAATASALVLVVSVILWLPDALLLLLFIVAQFGRLPVVTPLIIYPILLSACMVFIAPPLVALIASLWHLGRPSTRRSNLRSAVGALPIFLVAFGLVTAWCWFSPAYTDERPLQRPIRYVNNGLTGEAYWESGGNEPGMDVAQGAPVAESWRPITAAFDVGTPLDRMLWPAPFAYRARSAVAAAAPVELTSGMVCGADTCDVEITAVPRNPGLVLVFGFPPGVLPEEASLAGAEEDGRYRAIYAAVPEAGVTYRARIARADATRMKGMHVTVVDRGVPGGSWPHLPAWLPQEHVVWHARSYFVVPVSFAER